jgi:ferredoxin
LKKILKLKKLNLNAACELFFPGNYIIVSYYNLVNRNEETRKLLFKEAEKSIVSFSNVIKEKKNFYEIKNNISRVFTMLFNIPNNLSNFRQWDKSFYSDSKCNSCGICERICPVYNIKMENGKPQWLHNCQMCMACIQFCPKEAIQFKKGTLNRKRYHHPTVTLNEMLRN